MFHRLRKIIRKTLGGGNHLPSPSLYVQGLKEKTYPEYQESVFPIMKTAKKTNLRREVTMLLNDSTSLLKKPPCFVISPNFLCTLAPLSEGSFSNLAL